jgi:glycosyltransferase involved in cell wall biosynthesis
VKRSRRRRLAIVCSHPIQYYAPLFRALAARQDLEIMVFYTWSQRRDGEAFDTGFGRSVEWDIPLLDRYPYRFVDNIARRPGTQHFWGLRNPGLIDAIRDWEAEALLVIGWSYYSHLRVMMHFRGRLPVLFRGDSTLLDPVSRWRAMRRRMLLHSIYRNVDTAVAVGTDNREYFRWCGLSNERIRFAPHAVDNDRFADLEGLHLRRAELWRGELGIGPEQVAILFAGKLQSKKDPLLLLRAFRSLDCPGAQDAHLIIAGDGELRGELERQGRAHDRIHFLPFQNQSQMPTLYRVADVFVLPSIGPGETWGLAVNEAMASARAVIASSRSGCARDLIQNDINGWVFTAASFEGLSSALQCAIALGRPGLRLAGLESSRIIAAWSIDACSAGIAAAVFSHPEPAMRRPITSGVSA